MTRATPKAPDRHHQLPNDPNALIRLIEKLEGTDGAKWTIREMATGWRVQNPDGGGTTIPRTLSGRKAANAHSALRNMGIDAALTRYEDTRRDQTRKTIDADREKAEAAIAAASQNGGTTGRKARQAVIENIDPKTEPHTVRRMVTPDEAAAWLVRPPATLPDGTVLKQRRLSDDHVGWLTDIILRGQWRITHQGIALAPTHNNTGMVLDGMHRLWAVVTSGVAVEMMVTFNAHPEDFATFDTMRTRTASDVLGMEGETDTMRLASTVRLIAAWKAWRKDPEKWKSWKSWSKIKPTNQDHLDLLAVNPGLRGHMRAASSLAGNPLKVNIPAFAVFRQLLEDSTPEGTEPLFSDSPEITPGVGDRFFHMLRTGHGFNDEDGHPVHTLRNWLLSKGYQRYGVSSSRQVQLLVAIKVWNSWVRGSSMFLIRIADGEIMQLPDVPAGLALATVNRRKKATEN